MIRTSIFILLLTAAVSCKNASEQKENQAEAEAQTQPSQPALEKVWETDSTFTTCESVLYDKSNNILYVSNIFGDPTGKDGKGSISKLNTDGSVKEMEWATGLNAPKGMAILNDQLYVTDIDELVEINLSDGTISNKYKVEDAIFLNDAATNGEDVYCSDNRTGKVHVLEDGQVKLVFENLKNINGLAFNDNGELFGLDNEGFRKYSLSSNEDPKMINDQVTGGDGLIVVNDSTYIASRWKGEIYLVVNGEETLLLDTKDNNSNTADIGYIPEDNLVLVPTFKANKVVAYKLTF